ncbi:hypothetical protein [Haloferax sp. YSMS24]
MGDGVEPTRRLDTEVDERPVGDMVDSPETWCATDWRALVTVTRD